MLPSAKWRISCSWCSLSTLDLRSKTTVIEDWNRRKPPIDMCSHGVNDGEYCEACNVEYKRAAIDLANQVEEEA